jgi:hypothetical protein
VKDFTVTVISAAYAKLESMPSTAELEALVHEAAKELGLHPPTKSWDEEATEYLVVVTPTVLQTLWGRFLLKAAERWEDLIVIEDSRRFLKDIPMPEAPQPPDNSWRRPFDCLL